MNQKTFKVIYWLLITPVALNMFFAEILFLIKKDFSVAVIEQLGYPQYFLYILGSAKILGSLALLQNWFRGPKEWAYAGYSFNLLAAAASHLFVNDAAQSILIPLITLALLLSSYWLWKQFENTTKMEIAEAA